MMILLALGLAGLTAFLIMPPPRHGHRVLRRILPDVPTDVAASRRPWLRLALITAGVMIIGLGFMIGGGRGVAYATAGVIIGGLALRLIGSGVRRHQAVGAAAEVAEACRALAAELRVGRVPVDALAAAAADHPILAEADRVSRLGGDVVPAWRSRASRPGQAGLLELARGWELCRATGAPLSSALDQIADNLESDQTIRMMVAGELAAPRASGKIMAALPVLGIGLGYLIGGDPLTFLWQEPVGWACLLGGTVLAAIGILWIDGLARQAETN